EGAQVREWESPDPLGDLERLIAATRAATLPGLPPFCGGAVGYAGYDTVRYIERLPNAPADDRGLPDMSFAIFHKMVVFDHIDKTMYVIVMARVDHGAAHVGESLRDSQSRLGETRPRATGEATDLQRVYDDTCRAVDELVARLSRPAADLPPTDIDTAGEPQ